jgi:hypothetical protein
MFFRIYVYPNYFRTCKEYEKDYLVSAEYKIRLLEDNNEKPV